MTNETRQIPETKNTRPADFYLENDIQNIILEIAGLFNDLTTSDLQGVVMVKAKEIIKLVREVRQ